MKEVPTELQGNLCLYCQSDLIDSSWNTEWGDSEQHYKSIKCNSCDKKNWLKVNYLGSGHDNVMEDDTGLEGMVKKVNER